MFHKIFAFWTLNNLVIKCIQIKIVQCFHMRGDGILIKMIYFLWISISRYDISPFLQIQHFSPKAIWCFLRSSADEYFMSLRLQNLWRHSDETFTVNCMWKEERNMIIFINFLLILLTISKFKEYDSIDWSKGSGR